tara:strand:+ start:9153 stop:12962 length:3810 start_codon:yes stop_codon:yes gene_type:complete
MAELANSYFVECSAKNSMNKYSNTKFSCDFQPFLLKEGSTINLSSAYINSVGAGDLISINESGINQDNKARLIFNFYGRNSGINQQRESYNFSDKPNVFLDVDNKEMLLYRFEELGKKEVVPQVPVQPLAMYQFDDMFNVKEDPYVPCKYLGQLHAGKLQNHFTSVELGYERNLAVMTTSVGKFQGEFIEIELGVKFTTFTGNNAIKLLKRCFVGCYLYLFCKFPAANGDPDRWLNGVVQVIEVKANAVNPVDNYILCDLDAEGVSQINFTAYSGNDNPPVMVASYIEVYLGFPVKPDPQGALYMIPPKHLSRDDPSSAFLPVGTKLYNYKLQSHAFESALNSYQAISHGSDGYDNSDIRVMDKTYDKTREDDYWREGEIETATYTVGGMNTLDVVMANKEDYDRLIDYFFMDEINALCMVKIEGTGANPTFSMYKFDNVIDASLFKFRLTPTQEFLGLASDHINRAIHTYPKADSKVIIISVKHFLKDAYLGMTVSTNVPIGISNDDPSEDVWKEISMLMIQSSLPNQDAKPLSDNPIDQCIIVSNDCRISRDFIVHYRYKDIIIENLSYVSPSDLATETTQQLHAVTNAFDNLGNELEGTKSFGITQNEMIFPIWFPFNVKVDTNLNITEINNINLALDYTIYNFIEPTSYLETITDYIWIMDDGTEVMGTMNEYMKNQITPQNITAGYDYRIENTLIPIGCFVWIHRPISIPNVNQHNYFIYPKTLHTYYNRGDMTDGADGSSAKAIIFVDGVDIDDSVETTYPPIYDSQVVSGFPIKYISGQNCYASQLIGTNNPTIVFDETISKFSIQLLHQPYTTEYETQTATGGDNACILYFPSVNYKENLLSLGGVNMCNFFAEFYTKDQILPNDNDYIDPLSNDTPNSISLGFWKKFGFSQTYLNNNSGFTNDMGINGLLLLKGTTTSDVDSSFALITQADSGVNMPRYISANIYRASSVENKDATAEQAKYLFSSITGLELNNASLGYSLPNTSGTGDTYETQNFTVDIDVENKNSKKVEVHAKGSKNPLASTLNPDRHRHRHYIVKVTSSKILAPSLPVKISEPFFYVLSNLISDGSYITSSTSKANICGVVSKLNASLDYFYSYVSPVSFMCRKDRIITSIEIDIVNSELAVPSLVDENSVVIFQITEPVQPSIIYPSILQEQEEQIQLIQKIEQKDPKTDEPITNILREQMFPQPSVYKTYQQYIDKIPQGQIPLSKRQYAQQIRSRKKADNLIKIAKKINYFSKIIGMKPEDIDVTIFSKLLDKF